MDMDKSEAVEGMMSPVLAQKQQEMKEVRSQPHVKPENLVDDSPPHSATVATSTRKVSHMRTPDNVNEPEKSEEEKSSEATGNSEGLKTSSNSDNSSQPLKSLMCELPESAVKYQTEQNVCVKPKTSGNNTARGHVQTVQVDNSNRQAPTLPSSTDEQEETLRSISGNRITTMPSDAIQSVCTSVEDKTLSPDPTESRTSNSESNNTDVHHSQCRSAEDNRLSQTTIGPLTETDDFHQNNNTASTGLPKFLARYESVSDHQVLSKSVSEHQVLSNCFFKMIRKPDIPRIGKHAAGNRIVRSLYNIAMAWRHVINNEHGWAHQILAGVLETINDEAADDLVRVAVCKVRSLLELLEGNTDGLRDTVWHCLQLPYQATCYPGMAAQAGWVFLHNALAKTTDDPFHWLGTARRYFNQDAGRMEEAQYGEQIVNVCLAHKNNQLRGDANPPSDIFTQFYTHLVTHPIEPHVFDLPNMLAFD